MPTAMFGKAYNEGSLLSNYNQSAPNPYDKIKSSNLFDEGIANCLNISVKILNGKQVFLVFLSNFSEIATNYTLSIYKNYEINQTINGFINVNETINIEVTLDEIMEADYLFFALESEEKESDLANNNFSYYSVANEYADNLVLTNPYYQKLNTARSFL